MMDNRKFPFCFIGAFIGSAGHIFYGVLFAARFIMLFLHLPLSVGMDEGCAFSTTFRPCIVSAIINFGAIALT